MGDRAPERSDGNSFWPATVLLAISLFLPGLVPGFGWLTFVIPAIGGYLLLVNGTRRGLTGMAQATLVAGAAAMATGGTGHFLFSCTFLAAAVLLGRSMARHEPPWKAGAVALAAIVCGWLLLWLVAGLVLGINPYTETMAAIDTGIGEAAAYYKQHADLSEELRAEGGSLLEWMRRVARLIFPSVLLASLLTTVWGNLLLLQAVLKRKAPLYQPWPPFIDWRLPEWTVWGLIASGLLALLPAPLKPAGINGVIVFATLYFFQGLAVAGTLFSRWSVPTLLRYILYALLLLQAYGLLFTAVLGLIDTWAPFKKTGEASPPPNA